MKLIYILFIYLIGGITTYICGKIKRNLRNSIALLTMLVSFGLHTVFYGKIESSIFNNGIYKLHIGSSMPYAWFLGELFGFTGLISVLFSFKEKRTDFFLLSMIFLTGLMVLLVNVGDLLTLFISLEMIILLSFFAIQDAEKNNSFKYLIWNTVGAYLVLAGILILHRNSGAFPIKEVYSLPRKIKFIIFLLLTGGFMVTSAFFPFYTWMRDIYLKSPYSFIIFFSGTVSKVGIYGCFLITFYLFPTFFSETPPLKALFFLAGAFTVLLGTIKGIRSKEIKEILVYVNIGSTGLLTMVLGLCAPYHIKLFLLLFITQSLSLFLIYNGITGNSLV